MPENQHFIQSQMQEVQETLLNIFTTKLEEITTAIQDTKSSDKIQTLQTSIDKLSTNVKLSGLDLEELDTKLDNCNSVIRSTCKVGNLILEHVSINNSSLSQTKEKLDKIDAKVEMFNMSLNSVANKGEQVYDMVSKLKTLF